ncbi:hypothetical protein AB205_0122130 [Aquarana catesbeiana]|uniref:VWFC domain-containing protein n=2 Tax=Aquarana catesbeiana TaxID=8400 RepID=A0A2G9R580_AQUCT|nr:hypothetical protein AB205_0122130 [Aquarana catesbeiana]
MDCCKKCPEEEQNPVGLVERMQSDEPRNCKVRGQVYSNNEKWHPTFLQLGGEVKCLTCVCVDGVPQCNRQKWKCSDPECKARGESDGFCCSDCHDQTQEEDEKYNSEEPAGTWSY